jgi:hypothetical protein
MYDQLPMQVSLMERQRQRDALMRESEVRRALGNGPAPADRLRHWVAAARDRLAVTARPRQAAAASCRTKLGSSAAA